MCLLKFFIYLRHSNFPKLLSRLFIGSIENCFRMPKLGNINSLVLYAWYLVPVAFL